MKNENIYIDNQYFNIHALLTDPQFHNRMTALTTIYKQMKQKHINWAIYSSGAMFLLGITPDFHDWDLLTAPEDANESFTIFESLNAQKHPEPPETKARYFDPPCKTYTLSDTDFDISPEFTIMTFGTQYMYHFNPQDIEYIEINDFSLPVCPAEALFVMYYMMTGWQPNRKMKVKWLQDYLENNLRHPSILEDALKQNIPYWIKVEITNILKKKANI